MAIRNRTRGTVLCTDERWARTPASRARGLLGRDGLLAGEALVITPCNSVHMFGMRFAIDVVFVRADGIVERAIPNLRPWRATRLHLRARHTIELPTGAIAASGTEPGDALDFDDPVDV